jgi:CcmD family protein
MQTTAVDAFSAVNGMAPFVIAAYGLIWATLVVFVGLTFRRLGKLEKELCVVEDSVARRQRA